MGSTNRFKVNRDIGLWRGILSDRVSSVAILFVSPESTNQGMGLTFDGQFEKLDFTNDKEAPLERFID